MDSATAIHDRLAVVESLIRRALDPWLVTPAPQEISGPEADFATVAAYFLLDLGPDGGVELFIRRTLVRLVQQLSHSTEQLEVQYRGQVRGRVLWPATYKARYGEDYDPTRFVCREVHHRYDTLENQLLKYVMDQIGECLKAVPEVIRQGTCYLPATERRLSLSTAVRLGQMESVLNNLWRHVRLQEVTLPQRITEAHLLRAETSRTEEYALVAQVYRRYREVVLFPSWGSLVEIGQRVLPLPVRPGGAGEPWIELGATVLRARKREQ